MCMMCSWNPVYNLVTKIKKEYENQFGKITNYDVITRKNELDVDYQTGVLEYWIEKLNKEEYNEWIEPLQFTYFGTLVLIRYGLQELQQGMWTDPNSVYRECRSIVIDLEDEEIVLAPFRKFFNINEVFENMFDTVIEEIRHAKSIEITDKLDGSMQVARSYKGKIVMSGSKALDPTQSWRLADGYSMLTKNHEKMIHQNQEFTFIFEYISLRDSHVVKYLKKDEGLYLIGIRNVTDGTQLSYREVERFSKMYGVPMTKLEDKTFDQVIEDSKTLSSDIKEGWVINIDGHLIKLKCDDYVKLHRILDKLSSINVIIHSIADGTYDDLMSKVPTLYRPRIEKVSKLIFDYLKETELNIKYTYDAAPKDNKKDFMIWVDKFVDKNIRGYVRCKYLGREYSLLKNQAGGYKKLSELGILTDYSALFGEE